MKKSSLVKIVLCIFLFIIFLLNGCSEKSTVIGKWVCDTEDITFLNDNEYSINSGGENIETGKYSIIGNQIKFISDQTDNSDSETHICEFKIEDNKLTLTYEDQTVTFIKE